MMERYKIRTSSGYFGIGWEEDGTVTIAQGAGNAPTLGEVNAGLAALPKNAPMMKPFHPWRIVRREGMSGCQDYAVLELSSPTFGFERRRWGLHVSMNGKLNQGYRGPLALLQLVLEREPLDGNEFVQIEILPDEDNRSWNQPRPVGLADLREALNGN